MTTEPENAQDNATKVVVEKEEPAETMAEEKVIGSTSGKSKPTNMKSKEEKKAIREARMAANRHRNQYKKRSGGVSGKNGPRAINPGSNF
eukprot:gene28710-34658_t